MTDTLTDYRARVMGCWLGKAIGVLRRPSMKDTP